MHELKWDLAVLRRLARAAEIFNSADIICFSFLSFSTQIVSLFGRTLQHITLHVENNLFS
jgi:hypothetical protein